MLTKNGCAELRWWTPRTSYDLKKWTFLAARGYSDRRGPLCIEQPAQPIAISLLPGITQTHLADSTSAVTICSNFLF